MQGVDEALTLGASGFLLKSSSYEELLTGVRAAAGGDGALSPSVARRVIGGYGAHRRSQRVDAADADRLAELTPRELDVLRLIGEGLSNSEIAADLVVSEHTVKTHVSRTLTKPALRSRGQAAAFARRVSLQAADGAKQVTRLTGSQRPAQVSPRGQRSAGCGRESGSVVAEALAMHLPRLMKKKIRPTVSAMWPTPAMAAAASGVWWPRTVCVPRTVMTATVMTRPAL
ncbi:hypothetical protein ACTIVE_0227 [Actinomadura verrucosospora]|uniref:HTH luxR-type domain-containing protein n=1 Tax=Actinomadura verrucosospora TaxID=46165 RepID=A0A7D3VP47_ACTVE|nr:hypothetical protein ACTIVE_0227 [Actinomadura verrucosospora]